MGRPSRYDEAAILAGATLASAGRSPQELTIAAVAARAGVPVGSIYHRYASRDAILADLWLGLVEPFQERFLATLDGPDPLRAALAAVRWVCAWVRTNPREARLLLLHRREDFGSNAWPATYRRRARRLARAADAALARHAARLTGRRGGAGLRAVRLALVDLPSAALRRDIEAGAPPSRALERVLLDACAHVLRGARRKRP